MAMETFSKMGLDSGLAMVVSAAVVVVLNFRGLQRRRMRWLRISVFRITALPILV